MMQDVSQSSGDMLFALTRGLRRREIESFVSVGALFDRVTNRV